MDWQIIGLQDCGLCSDVPDPDIRDAFPNRVASNGSIENKYASVMILLGEAWMINGPIKRSDDGRMLGVPITDGSRQIFVINFYGIPNTDNHPPPGHFFDGLL